MHKFLLTLQNAPWEESSFDFILFFAAIFLSGFFSGSETALTALPETKIRQLIATNTRKNKLLQYWVDQPNKILTTVLIGNNIVNAFSTAFATLIAQNLFSNQAVSIAVGFATIATIVIGEITPKTYAKHNAEKIAPIALVFLIPLYHFLYPIVWFFSQISKIIVKLLGKELSRSGPFITQEDIEFYVQLGQKEGVLEDHEEELISSVLEFTDTVVKEIMVPRTEIVGANKESSLDEVIQLIIDSGHSRVPVYSDNIDNIIGIFHGREILNLFHQNTEQFNLEPHANEAIFIPQQMKLSAVLRIFQKKKSHLAVVVDEYGGTAGIVSLEDVLEELVGEIQDEYDEENKEIYQIAEDRYVILGRVYLDDIEEVLDCKFPESPNFESLAGFLIDQSGTMPVIGDRIAYGSWLFVITDADQKHVEKCEAVKIHKKESSKAITLPPIKKLTK